MGQTMDHPANKPSDAIHVKKKQRSYHTLSLEKLRSWFLLTINWTCITAAMCPLSTPFGLETTYGFHKQIWWLTPAVAERTVQ